MSGPNERGIADDASQYEDLGESGGAPPPLPRRARPRNATEAGISDDAGLYEDVVAEGSTEALELDARWLYKKHGEVFGPVTSKDLLHRLYDGEIDAETEISPEDGEFLALRRYGAFRGHLPKVEAHRRHAAELEAEKRRAKRTAMLRRAAFVVVGSLLAIAVFAGVVAKVRERRAAEAQAETERKVEAELAALLESVSIDPPLEDIASDTPEDEPEAGTRRPGRRRGRRAVAKFTGGGGTGELSRQEIMAGVASIFGGFKSCIVRQMQSDPESVPEQVILSFTVDNKGKVGNVDLDDRILRRSPMKACMQGHLAGLKYRANTGEVRNVEYPITIGRR